MALLHPYIAFMGSALYNRDILRLAAAIPHHVRLAAPQASVEKRSPICGSRVAVDVVVDEGGRLIELGQEVRACALGQASAALMGAHAVGCDAAALEAARDALAGFLAGDRADPGDWPGIELLRDAQPFTARHASILLAFQAVAQATREASR